MSFYAKYWSTNKNCLLGAVMKGRSCRYEKREDAELRLQIIQDLQPHAAGTIVEFDGYPEIFIHCEGSIAQGIGGRCFKCGKILTVEDAIECDDRNKKVSK